MAVRWKEDAGQIHLTKNEFRHHSIDSWLFDTYWYSMYVLVSRKCNIKNNSCLLYTLMHFYDTKLSMTNTVNR